MRVVSFGTEGRFEQHLDVLRRSLDKHGLPHQLEVIGKRKKLMAALEKPRFILDRLDDTLLWLDADSFVTGPITLPEGDWDAGFLKHWRTGSTFACCALAFRPTDKAREFLERWDETCQPAKNFSGTEHDRMVIVMEDFSLSQVELTDCLHGNLIVNYRIRKERVI